MNPAMMNPEMMRAAQDMMAKMSPEDMQNMMKMQQEMMSNPAMMQQAQQMMSNPAMMQNAAEMMKNMSPDDVRRNMKQAEAVLPKRAAATTAVPTISVVERLKTSKLSVPETVIAAVEKGEAAKVEGNSSFKSADYSAAATKYCSAIELVEPSLKQLSGADKKAVAELMTACQLNLANCHLKLQDWDAATAVCTNVLERGEDRKARFRRGDALRAQGKLEEARADLAVAVKMDPSDAVVVGKLREVEAALGIEEEEDGPLVEEISTSSAGGGSSSGAGWVPPPMPGMPGGRMPDPAQVDSMLDQMTPEQLTAQAEMMDNLTPEQMRAMGLPEGVDREQLKMASQMMKNMGKDEMKSMMKMAAQMAPQMQASRAASSGGAGASTAAMPPMPRRSATTPMPGMTTNPDMSLDQGMEMMKNMSPDMMKAGMEMMKNMDPAMIKSMSKMMGRDIDESQLEQMQSMMSNMSPEDMEKWAGRAQKVAAVASVPMAAYKKAKGYISHVGNTGWLAILVGIWAVMFIGHMSSLF